MSKSEERRIKIQKESEEFRYKACSILEDCETYTSDSTEIKTITLARLEEIIDKTYLGCEYHSMSIGEFGDIDGDNNYNKQKKRLAKAIFEELEK